MRSSGSWPGATCTGSARRGSWRPGPAGGDVRVPGRGRAAELPDVGAVPAGERGRVYGGVPGDGDPGAARGAGAPGPCSVRRDEAEGEHVEAQGDELWADAAAGGPAQRGDRAAGRAGRP